MARKKLERPRLAVILTSYGHTSHGICFATKLLEGKQFDGYYEPPRCEVVSIHQMEVTANDVGVPTAKRHGVPMYPSVATALCRGGDRLDVDGVVLIGEHGTYPHNERGQQLYPRRELFDQIAAVYRQSGRSAPLFNDKHLSWNWEWARWMMREVKALKIPFMAGSSLPYSQFEPMVPLPWDDPIDHLIAIGYGGIESYGFHSLETGQFVTERRRGWETGVSAVQCVSGAEVWKGVNEGRWPRDLTDAAFKAVKQPRGRPQDYTANVHAFDIWYRDGHRMTVFMANDFSQEFAFAYRKKGGPIRAASYYLDPVPRLKHFSATVRALEEMYLTGRATEPAERTYLTTGMLAYLIESHFRGGPRLETPDLDISYRPARRPAAWREVLKSEEEARA